MARGIICLVAKLDLLAELEMVFNWKWFLIGNFDPACKTTLCWTLSWCIPTNPVVHRSALFALVNSDDADDAAT